MAKLFSSAVLCIALIACGNAAGDEAAQPSASALVRQARHYEHAEGVPRDYGKAIELYCLAARDGDPEAAFSLGWMYANGRGVARDDAVAAHLFALAAERGHVYAQRMLHYVKQSEPAPSEPAPLPACLAAPPKAESETQAPSFSSFPKGPVYDLVMQLAPAYNIDPRLALAVIAVESGFDAKAVSSKNAQGLMQLLPETAQRFRVKNTFDPRDNIKGGLAYLQWLWTRFRGDLVSVLAAYNAGAGAVERHHGVPPYPETREYVRRVTLLYGHKPLPPVSGP